MSEKSGDEIQQRIAEWAKIELWLVFTMYAQDLGKEIDELSEAEKEQAYSEHIRKNYAEHVSSL